MRTINFVVAVVVTVAMSACHDSPQCDDLNYPTCVFPAGRQGALLFCGDVSVAAQCVNGHLTCPTNTVDFKTCTCSGPVSACVACAFAGWRCDDGGADMTLDAGTGEAAAAE